MAFKKGQSGNLKGRPIGSANKSSVTLREKVTKFIESNANKLQRDFDKLDPEKRLIFWEKMLGYSLPKLTAGSFDINFQSMSESDLDKIIDKLKQSANETD